MRVQKLVTLLVLLAAFLANTAAQRRPISSIPTGRKYLALTFDDGPTTNETVQILDELKRLNPNAKVTFYINGDMVNDATRPILQRMVAEGHDVDNHGYYHYSHGGSHPDSREILSTTKQARENIQRNSQLIFDVTGYWPFSFRAPFFEWGSQLDSLDRILNMPFVHAVYDTHDWSQVNQSDPKGMAAALLSSDRVTCGTIILMHDAPEGRRQGTVDALKYFIPQLIEEGYEFVTVRELFAIKQAQPEVFIPSSTWNPNHRVPFHAVNGVRYSHQDFWPNNINDWWLQDWWTSSTPPWERDLSIPDTTTQVRYTVQVTGGTASELLGPTGTTVSLSVGTPPEGQFFKEWRVVSGGVTITNNSFTIGTSDVVIEAVWENIGDGGDGNYITLLPWEWAEWDSYADTVGSTVNITSDGKTGDLVADLELAEESSYLGLLLWLEGSVDFSGTTGVEITYSANRDLRFVLSDTTSHKDSNWAPCGVVLQEGQNKTVFLSLAEARSGLSSSSSTGINGFTFYHNDGGETVNLTVTSIKIFGAQFIDDTPVLSDNRQIARESAIEISGISSNRLHLTVPTAGAYTISIHSLDGKLLAQTRANLSAGANSLALDTRMARGLAIVNVQSANVNTAKRMMVK
ncbi:polysaccharide deacetylase [Chitinispirillum alkaliphilum]|nr:polysaccharide deacetylase [Chitinispirillum alkaliphilum]